MQLVIPEKTYICDPSFMHITVRQPKGTRNLVFEIYIHDALSFSRTYKGRQATTQRYLNQKVVYILQSLLSHTRADFEEFILENNISGLNLYDKLKTVKEKSGAVIFQRQKPY